MHDREGAEQMEMIYNLILKLSFFAVLGSVILQMIPDHGFQKYVRLQILGVVYQYQERKKNREEMLAEPVKVLPLEAYGDADIIEL